MKLPKQAKKVFAGEIFDTYQWPQKMYNGTTAIFEMLKRVNTAQVVAVKNGKILVGMESQPHIKRGYSLFGGRVDKNETPLNAAKRELKEESGLVSKDWKLLHSYQPLSKLDWTIYYYIARDCKFADKQNLDNGEKIKIMEISFEKFYQIWTKDFIGHWLSYYLAKLKADGKIEQFKKYLFKNCP